MSSRFGASRRKRVPSARPAPVDLGPSYLTRRLQHHFSATICGRGADYARHGNVTSCRGSKVSLKATVRGTHRYEVRADVLGPGTLGVSCTCPYFDSGSCCKHLWAVLRPPAS